MSEIPKANLAAFQIGQFAERLPQGYYALSAALEIANKGQSAVLSPPTLPGHIVPIGTVRRKDGTEHAYHFPLFHQRVIDDPSVVDDFKLIWISGAIIRLGDALQKNGYFDRAPELELVYHIRNGVAHGNKFNITRNGRVRLATYPAHNNDAWVKSDLNTTYEIKPELNGKDVLFDYMDAADILDLFQSVGIYLIRMGNGDPLRIE